MGNRHPDYTEGDRQSGHSSAEAQPQRSDRLIIATYSMDEYHVYVADRHLLSLSKREALILIERLARKLQEG